MTDVQRRVDLYGIYLFWIVTSNDLEDAKCEKAWC